MERGVQLRDLLSKQMHTASMRLGVVGLRDTAQLPALHSVTDPRATPPQALRLPPSPPL